jgi:hypothetical protein
MDLEERKSLIRAAMAAEPQDLILTNARIVSLPAPFMMLSFISLPTVPELGLADRGLVDLRKHEIISSFIE